MNAAPGVLSVLGRVFSPLPSKPCEGPVLAWAQSYLKSSERSRNPPMAPSVQRQVARSFEREAFKKVFGNELNELSLKDGFQMSYLLMQTARCPGMPLGTEASIANLVKPFVDEAPLSRRQVTQIQLALPVLDTWAQQQLDKLIQAEQASAQSLDVASVQAQNEAAGSLGAWTPQLTGAETALRMLKLNQRAISAQALRDFIVRAEAATADLNQLNSLAAQANQSDEGRDPDLLAQARKAVQTQVNRYFDTALQRKVSEAQGVAGYRWLQAWPQDYGVLLALVPPQQAKDSQALVTARMQSLSRATLAAERTRYSLEVATLPHGQQALVAGKAFDARWVQEGAPLIPPEDRQAFDRERAQRHQKDLTAALPNLLQEIARTPTATALEQLRTTYLNPDDAAWHDGQRLNAALAERLTELSPWNGLPGADYLNAIYTGDHARLDLIDRNFREPYQRMMMPVLQTFGSFMSGLAKMSGLNVDGHAFLSAQFERMSLIRPMMAIYLVEYEGRMKPCLEAEPLRFKITTTSETVYRNGYGSYLYSVPHPDQVSYFNVNRRFGPAFEKVGTMEPDSIVRRMLEQSFKKKDSLGVSDLIDGTRLMMARLTQAGCQSPLTRQMETNLLSWATARL